MRREMSVAIIIGLLWGSALWAPGAVMRPRAAAARTTPTVKGISLPAAASQESPLSRYAPIAQRDLFRPAIEPSLPKPKPKIDLPVFPVEVVKPVWQSPIQGWTYAGYASLDGVMVAILQEPNTGEAAFLKQGEQFKSGTVEEITTTSVRLNFGEESQTLPKSAEYNVVPLSATGAAVAQNAPTPAPMPQRGGPRFPQMGPYTRPTDSRMQQVANQLRQDWAARRAQMMERMRNAPPGTMLPPMPGQASPPPPDGGRIGNAAPAGAE